MKARLWNNDRAAAEATDSTIRALPGGAKLSRTPEGEVAFDGEGFVFIDGASGFTAFALKSQGYVKEIIE